MEMRFSESGRKAIAIAASYISKAGKKTPYIGKFWSDCASQAKRGLEILGIGIGQHRQDGAHPVLLQTFDWSAKALYERYLHA